MCLYIIVLCLEFRACFFLCWSRPPAFAALVGSCENCQGDNQTIFVLYYLLSSSLHFSRATYSLSNFFKNHFFFNPPLVFNDSCILFVLFYPSTSVLLTQPERVVWSTQHIESLRLNVKKKKHIETVDKNTLCHVES